MREGYVIFITLVRQWSLHQCSRITRETYYHCISIHLICILCYIMLTDISRSKLYSVNAHWIYEIVLCSSQFPSISTVLPVRQACLLSLCSPYIYFIYRYLLMYFFLCTINFFIPSIYLLLGSYHLTGLLREVLVKM